MTDTSPEAVAGMVERLLKQRGLEMRDPMDVSIAAMLTALSAEVEKQSDEVARLRIELADAAFERDKLRPERDQARADLAEAVGLLGDASGCLSADDQDGRDTHADIHTFLAKHT